MRWWTIRISIGSGNGLSPIRRQAITWTNAHLLPIGPLGTNFNEIQIKIQNFSFKKVHLKMSAKWRPLCPGGRWINPRGWRQGFVLGVQSLTYVNTLRPRQNGRHFADDIFKCIFLNEIVWISIEISLKFVRKGSINNIPALVLIMAWRRPGDKPLSEPMMVSVLTHICVTRPQWVKLSLTLYGL